MINRTFLLSISHREECMFHSIFFIFCTQAFAYVTQTNWRWRNNDGSEAPAKWRAPVN